MPPSKAEIEAVTVAIAASRCPRGCYANGPLCACHMDAKAALTAAEAVRKQQLPVVLQPNEVQRSLEELNRLRERERALVEALRELHAWSLPFVEKTPISAETLWRRFPMAIKQAADAIAAHDTTGKEKADE